ncbi:MAG: DUF333 domain-containing protein [Oligoflexia bacterium]|nr:DUF333 domain-containing protein [Oligoflexia bacterium]
MSNNIFISIIFILISISSNLSLSADLYLDSSHTKKISFTIQDSYKIYIPIPSTNPKNPEYFVQTLLKKRVKFPEGDLPLSSGGGGGANPAAILCKEMGGREMTLFDKNSQEYSICEWADKSMIFSWDLFKIYSQYKQQKK